MKIRSGFVSNSSSSSFIITYDKTKVTHDPEEVYNLIVENPDITILFMGYDCGEGDDIFILDDEQKSTIRKFKKEFIKKCSGMCPRLVDIDSDGKFIYKDSPTITAYYGPDANLIYDDMIDGFYLNNFEVDMSDVNLFSGESLSVNEFNSLPEDKKEESNEYYKIKESRQKEAYDKYVENKINSLTHDNIEAKEVGVSYRSCSEDIYEFRNRYISNEDEYVYDSLTRHYINSEETIFTIIYDEFFVDKKDIKNVLSRIRDYKNCYITRYDDALETGFNMDFYEIGPKELELLLNKESYIWNDNMSCKLFTNLYILENGDRIANVQGTIHTYSGRVADIKAGQDLKGFKDTFCKNPED